MPNFILVIFIFSVVALINLSGTLANGSCPNGIISQGVDEQDKNDILQIHNNFRKLVATGTLKGQPRAINLKKMSWDDCLASEAQRISNNCLFAHQHATCPGYERIGQNLHLTSSLDLDSKSQWKWAITKWFQEHEIFEYGGPSSHHTRHYRQLVKADTNKVGCGFTFFKNNTEYAYKRLYVCNYGPVGNIKDEVPYKTGKSGCEKLC